MSEYNIAGIQQIGVGTVDFRKSWNWFIGYFGADIKILEDDTVDREIKKLKEKN